MKLKSKITHSASLLAPSAASAPAAPVGGKVQAMTSSSDPSGLS